VEKHVKGFDTQIAKVEKLEDGVAFDDMEMKSFAPKIIQKDGQNLLENYGLAQNPLGLPVIPEKGNFPS